MAMSKRCWPPRRRWAEPKPAPPDTPLSLGEAACRVLTAAQAADKVALTAAASEAWRAGKLSEACTTPPPDRPARPQAPRLLAPREMPRRRAGGVPGRIALLHAVAHIELNAIDLAWDLIARFGQGQPREFQGDWVKVAAEEALHFTLLERRLESYGTRYGDLPAHDGLWSAAAETAGDVLARLAIVPLVLEARGLDVTPGIAAALEAAGDAESASVLALILRDEIGHVASGHRWFVQVCETRGLPPIAAWQELVERHFKGRPKGPLNTAAREAAGLTAAWRGLDIAE